MIRQFKNTFVTLSLTALVACGSGGSSTSEPVVVACGTDPLTSLDEGNEGDYSGDPAAPKQWKLAPGANSLISGTDGQREDMEYITFTVDSCDILSSITLAAFTTQSSSNIGFMALQSGSFFTVAPDEAQDRADEFLASTNFGLNVVGQDILNLAGVTQPLQAGTYAMWIRQSPGVSEYRMLFNVDRVR